MVWYYFTIIGLLGIYLSLSFGNLPILKFIGHFLCFLGLIVYCFEAWYSLKDKKK